MSDKINDGGPAFPCKIPGKTIMVNMRGMSLRDYFAGVALNGRMAAEGEDPCMSYEELAIMAYEIADEMLKVRG